MHSAGFEGKASEIGVVGNRHLKRVPCVGESEHRWRRGELQFSSRFKVWDPSTSNLELLRSVSNSRSLFEGRGRALQYRFFLLANAKPSTKVRLFLDAPGEDGARPLFPDGLTPSTESAFFPPRRSPKGLLYLLCDGARKGIPKKTSWKKEVKRTFPFFSGIEKFFHQVMFPPCLHLPPQLSPPFFRGGGGEKKGPKRRRILLRNRQRGSELPICDVFPIFPRFLSSSSLSFCKAKS